MNQNETIQYLIDEGKITEEDIKDAERNALSKEKKRMLVRIHLQFCDLDHDIEGECNWYQEEQFADCWQLPCHRHWVKLFNDFIRSANAIKLLPEGTTEESSSSPNNSTLSD